MQQLQRPEWIYFNGELRPWEEGVLHISTEALTRGLNVFEGLKGYWNEDSSEFALIALREHYERLRRSSQLLYIPFEQSYDEFKDAVSMLVDKLLRREDDMWIRATLFVVDGHWGENTQSDLVCTAYHQTKDRPSPISVGISTWQRPGDLSLPARIKTSTNYQAGRLARIEGRRRGFGEMIMMNQWGRVAEASGSCVIAVRGNKLLTPPAHEGCLESITVDLVEIIAKDLGLDFERRPLERTELYVADELAIVGTLAELVPVEQIEDIKLEMPQRVLQRVADRFWKAVRGVEPLTGLELTRVR